MMARNDPHSNCPFQIHFYPLITVRQGCVCSLPISHGLCILRVCGEMTEEWDGKRDGRKRAGAHEVEKKGSGWNFNDVVNETGVRNPHATRSQFSFSKVY